MIKNILKTSVGKRSILTLASLILLAMTAGAGRAYAQQNQNRAQNANSGDIQVWHVRGPIYMLIGAGANITVSAGADGVLVVDTGTAQMSDKVIGAIRQIQNDLRTREEAPPLRGGAQTRSSVWGSSYGPPKPIRYIVNTSISAEHTGGNEKISLSGATITGGNVAGQIADAAEGALIFAHENVLGRMSVPPTGNQPAVAFKALPTNVYRAPYKLSHFFNGEGVLMIPEPAAHTDGDSIVYFRFSDVISAGDIFSTTSYPVIDIERGGNVQGILDGLNHILDLAVPEFRTEGGTWIIPGHGRLSDSADVGYYRDMVTIIRDRIQDMVKRGLTLQQVRAAKPSKDYDTRYGSNPSWTPDMFIEAVYRSLTAKK